MARGGFPGPSAPFVVPGSVRAVEVIAGQLLGLGHQAVPAVSHRVLLVQKAVLQETGALADAQSVRGGQRPEMDHHARAGTQPSRHRSKLTGGMSTCPTVRPVCPSEQPMGTPGEATGPPGQRQEIGFPRS